jgi:hypothetical protein
MEHEARWAISLCRCAPGMIHMSYGNATLHISIEDIGDLAAALEKMNEAVKQNEGDEEKDRSIH